MKNENDEFKEKIQWMKSPDKFHLNQAESLVLKNWMNWIRVKRVKNNLCDLKMYFSTVWRYDVFFSSPKEYLKGKYLLVFFRSFLWMNWIWANWMDFFFICVCLFFYKYWINANCWQIGTPSTATDLNCNN